MKQIFILFLFIVGYAAISNATVYYVSSDAADDTGDGTTWITAKKTIAAAYALAGNTSNVDDIYVKGGTYNFTTSLVMDKMVNLYGGFTGLSETETPATRALSDVDGNGRIEPWEFSNPSILSSTQTNPNSNLTASAFQFSTTANTKSVVFNGFTITHIVTTTNGAQRTFDCKSGITTVENVTFKNSSINSLQYSSTSNRAVLMSAMGVVKNCLFEKNTVVVKNTRFDKYTMPIVSLEPTTKFTGCVLRNNSATVNYSLSTDATATFVLGLILHSNGGASVSNPTTIANCLIYNNEGVYIPKTAGGTAIPTYSAIVTVDAIGTTGSDSIINCLIANNKATSLQSAGLVVRRAATQNHFVFNNVMWNNKMDDGTTLNNFWHNGGTTTTAIMKGNIINTGGFFPTDDGILYDKNLRDLSATNTTGNAPNFKVPTTVIGNTDDGSVELANWAINFPSYLSGKGVATTILKDYSNNNYTATPAVGANELITHYRSKLSGDWNNTASWEWSNDNEYWSTATTVPDNTFQSVSVKPSHEITVTANATSPTLSINSGGQLTLNSGVTLDVTGNFTINSDGTNGTGTLVDKNTNGGLTISGTTNVKQYLTSLATGVTGRNWYISSPLSAALSSTITSATGNGLVYYDGTTNWPDAGTTMEVMKGYIAKSPAQNTTINFTGGTLNTGDRSVSNLPLGFSLVGNPYASYVDFALATKTNVTNSIWYRSKKDGSYNFHTYNVTGGISVKDGTPTIAPMQSFWIKTTSATNTFGFTNNLRSHQDQSDAANRLKAPKVSQQQLLRLKVSNAVNNDEAVIYFDENAANTEDDFDSQKMFNNISNVPEIYTSIGNEKLVINGMKSIPYETEIPLGFSTGAIGNFSISATEFKNFDNNTIIILKDYVQSTEQDLTSGTTYDFESGISNSSDRFSLIFRVQGTTNGIINYSKKLSTRVFANLQNQICIVAPEKCSYAVYNVSGQKQVEGMLKSTEESITKEIASGVYFVILSAGDQKEIRKVVIR